MTVYARIGNLSEGGLFLRTSTPLPTGSRALLRFRDGDAEEISAEATVMWSRGGVGDQAGMGLQFGPMDARRLETIRQMVQKHLGTNAK